MMRLAGVMVSNFSESAAGSQTMKIASIDTKSILVMWGITGMVNVVSTAAGFLILTQLGPEVITFSLAMAAGAILVMLAETMIPWAY